MLDRKAATVGGTSAFRRVTRRRGYVTFTLLAVCIFLCFYILMSCKSAEVAVHVGSVGLSQEGSVTPKLPAVWFAARTEPYSDPVLVYRDEYDPMPPREGESFITFKEYLSCVAARLRVDHHARVELPFLESERNVTFPYLTVMATGELRDVKGLMCDMKVPIRHLMYVQNGRLPAADAFFDNLQRTFAFTKRLKVVRYAHNAGFAGAVNTGIRDALTYPFEEVPFYFLSNNDVRFPPGLLETMLPKYYEAVEGHDAVIKQLEAEVATEPNEYTPADRRSPLLRSSGTDTYLVTSRLLPDRIRYDCVMCQRRAFSQYYGGLFLTAGSSTAVWGQTRLALEVIGLWDENFYPAYFEDSDYRWRQFALGFKDLNTPDGVPQSIHFGQVTLGAANDADQGTLGRTSRQGTGGVSQMSPLEEQQIFYKALGHVLDQWLPREYSIAKWRGVTTQTVRGPYHVRYIAGGKLVTHLPLDCWVWDVKKREAIAEATNRSLEYFRQFPRASKTVPFLSFLPPEERSRLASAVRLTPSLFHPPAYVEDGVLRKLP